MAAQQAIDLNLPTAQTIKFYVDIPGTGDIDELTSMFFGGSRAYPKDSIGHGAAILRFMLTGSSDLFTRYDKLVTPGDWQEALRYVGAFGGCTKALRDSIAGDAIAYPDELIQQPLALLRYMLMPADMPMTA